MKKIIYLSSLSLMLMGGSVLFSSCGSGEGDKASQGETAEKAEYVCPMKCEGSDSSEPGKCPVCKMDLVKNE